MEPAPPTTHGTHLSTAILLDVGSDVTVRDNPHNDDLVSLRFECEGCSYASIQGDLATVQRIIDSAAHQLMLISTRRAEAEETGERERGLAGVASLRDAAGAARQIGVNDVLELQRNAVR